MVTHRKLVIGCLLGVFVLVALLVGLWIWHGSGPAKSVAEQLAEIEAPRAVPEDQNAARIYEQLLQDPNALDVLATLPEARDHQDAHRVLCEPWQDVSYPQLARWLSESEFIIKLAEATRFPDCRFPIGLNMSVSAMERLSPMRQWAILMRYAANNDIGEARIGSALEKWACLLTMARHLYQQASLVEQLVALAIEKMALHDIEQFVRQDGLTADYAEAVASLALPILDTSQDTLSLVHTVDAMQMQKLDEEFDMGPLDRIELRIQLYRMNRAVERATGEMPDPESEFIQSYLQNVATARTIRIVIALQQYKHMHSTWPHSLDEIRAGLPEAVLIDPRSDRPFVYRPSEDGYILDGNSEQGRDALAGGEQEE